MWRCGIGPTIPQRLESGARLGDRVEHVEQIARRAGQPVEPRHDQHIKEDSHHDALEFPNGQTVLVIPLIHVMRRIDQQKLENRSLETGRGRRALE